MRRIVAGVALACALGACDRAPTTPATSQDAADEAPIADGTATLPASPTLPVARTDTLSPDIRVLPLAFRASEDIDALRERFGASNVRIEDIPGAEGETTRGVVLFPDDASRRAYVYFADPEHLQGIAQIRIVDPESTWSLGEGLRMGTTLAELVARNGAPIEFSGFGWDYGGAIAGFRGGKLEPSSANGPHTGFRLSPRPDLDPDIALPQGDTTFSSDDPKFADLATQVVIGELSISYPRQKRD